MRFIAILLAASVLPLFADEPAGAASPVATPITTSSAVPNTAPSSALVERLRTEAPPERPMAPAPRLWKASLVALAVAAVADLATSYGKRELNPALRGSDGRFGGRGIAVKSLVTGSALAGQWFLVRRAPESGRYAAIANFGMAGVFTAVAVHNTGTKRPAPTVTLAQ